MSKLFLEMRELFLLPARQPRRRPSSPPALSSSSSTLFTFFSIQTSEKFPFFRVVKCCRYSLMPPQSIQEGRLSSPAPTRWKFFLRTVSEGLPVFVCLQVRGGEHLLLQPEAEGLQHHRHAGSRRLRTRRVGTSRLTPCQIM